MIIYFRACEKQETISHVTRYKDINKTTMLQKCWLSIQSSVTEEDSIKVIHDAVSAKTLSWLKETSVTDKIEFIAVPEHSWDYHEHTITLVDTLEQTAKEQLEELHYIVEDDYLHVPNALHVLRATLKNSPLFAVPYDYIDRYTNPESSTVLLGPDRHWRTVNSSTMTVIAKGATWLEYINDIRAAASTSNDQVFRDIFSHTSCISPLPAVASHMTDRHQSPYVPWDSLWDSIDV